MRALSRSTSYPDIARHGAIGDRRTAALVADDGTLDWMCWPEFDSAPLFAAILDADKGGCFRLGPRRLFGGTQRYLDDSAVLQTIWRDGEGELELLDFMVSPAEHAPDGHRARAVIRRLRCRAGRVACTMRYAPGIDCDDQTRAGVTLHASVALHDGAADLTLGAGDEAWAVLAPKDAPPWSAARIAVALDETLQTWRRWAARLTCGGLGPHALRSALTLHLLSYAPSGAMVAAPTTSLPERIGGDRNYDYRFAWIRDASLCIARFCQLGDLHAAQRFLDWLSERASSTDAPLQVAYGIRGELDLSQSERPELHGYRGARPVRFGNNAFQQRQIGGFGYVADAALEYVTHGGEWRPEHARLLWRIADHVAGSWREPDSGIWEVADHHQYVSSKVMCWVALDRALRIAELTGAPDGGRLTRWRTERSRIHDDVSTRGFSDSLGAFRERYGADALDAAMLLIPVMGFLPADDPRVLATLERLAEQLSIDGFLYRWDPTQATDRGDPLGEFEGAFLPLMFWLATALAKGGRRAEAEAALATGERALNALGLLSEEYDPRDGRALGNFPQLFSHAEHLRALIAIRR